MPSAQNLQDLYTQELGDLISANQQMVKIVDQMSGRANDSKLQQLRDVAMIAQYQRMSHYGVAGFGTAAAYATALGKTDDANKLKQIVADIYRADEYSSQLAENTERAVANK